jgi:hypothetical protein
MQRTHRQPSPFGRKGSAAVELVMLIPLLALLLALLFTVGSAGVSSLNVTIRARSDGWAAARQGVSSSPLNLRSSAPDITPKSATMPLAYSLPRLSLGDAKGQFSAMQGSWDHRELLRDSDVHWNDAQRVAISGVDSLSDKINQFLAIENFVANILNDFDLEIASDAILDSLPINVSDAVIDQLLDKALREAVDDLGKAIEKAIENLRERVKKATNPNAIKSIYDDIRKLGNALGDLPP